MAMKLTVWHLVEITLDNWQEWLVSHWQREIRKNQNGHVKTTDKQIWSSSGLNFDSHVHQHHIHQPPCCNEHKAGND
jgi:hypothetical protein